MRNSKTKLSILDYSHARRMALLEAGSITQDQIDKAKLQKQKHENTLLTFI